MTSLNGFVLSDTLYAASELDLFTKIEVLEHPTLETIAPAIGLARHPTRVLLLACCATGLIERVQANGEYRNSTAARKSLRSGQSSNLRPFIRFCHQVQQRCGFHLLEALKSSTNLGLDQLPGESHNLYDRLAEGEGTLEMFQQGMAAYSLFGPKIVAFEELTNIRHLLDIGGGTGTVARHLQKTHENLQITVLDRPLVCATGRTENATPQLRFFDIDVFNEPWPVNPDGILFSHFLEIFSIEKIEWLYRRAHEVLSSGGRVFVWTLTCEPGEVGGLQAAKSSTYFIGVASGEGMAYPAAQHIALLQRCGFNIERVYDRQEFDHCGIVGLKI